MPFKTASLTPAESDVDWGQREYSVVTSDGKSSQLDFMQYEEWVLLRTSQVCGVKPSPYEALPISKEQAAHYFATRDSRCAGGGTEHIEFIASLAGISAEQYDWKYSTSYASPEGGTLYLMKRRITDV